MSKLKKTCVMSLFFCEIIIRICYQVVDVFSLHHLFEAIASPTLRNLWMLFTLFIVFDLQRFYIVLLLRFPQLFIQYKPKRKMLP